MPVFGFGHETCTSTTRPASPSLGQLIYQTDTDEYLKYVNYGGADRWMQAVLKPGRNLVVNGDKRVNQRNASASATTFGSGGTYFCDRFFAQAAGTGTIQAARSTDVPSGTPLSVSTRFTVSSAMSGTSSNVHLTTRLEGYESYRSGIQQTGKSVTLSFWVKSSKTGIYGVTVGSGYRGGATYSYIYYSANYTISAVDTWEFKSITIPGYASASWYTDNLVGLEITFNISDGTSLATGVANAWTTVAASAGYFYGNTGMTAANTWGASLSDNFLITGVQLEAGTAPSEFEVREYGDELRRCQRYFYTQPSTSSGYQWSNQGGSWDHHHTFPLPCEMRIVPVLSSSFSNVDNARNGGQSARKMAVVQYVRANNTSFGYYAFNLAFDASAEL